MLHLVRRGVEDNRPVGELPLWLSGLLRTRGMDTPEKAERTPDEPAPVPKKKGNTHGRALYACYAFLPLLKNAPMTSMTKNTIR